LLLDLAGETPFFIRIRRESNTDWDFFDFVVDAVAAGRLRRGDLFIVDNAAIHFAEETRPLLLALLDLHGVRVAFLPAYSPELNPCELVFAFVKDFVCSRRSSFSSDLFHLIALAFCSLRREQVARFFFHCIKHFDS
jgi:transposase